MQITKICKKRAFERRYTIEEEDIDEIFTSNLNTIKSENYSTSIDLTNSIKQSDSEI